MRALASAPIRLAILAAGLCADPFAVRADDLEGRRLFETHCQPCHGPTGEEGSGGDIRGMTAKDLARATRGFEQMPAIELNDAEVQAIAAYLDTLDDG